MARDYEEMVADAEGEVAERAAGWRWCRECEQFGSHHVGCPSAPESDVVDDDTEVDDG